MNEEKGSSKIQSKNLQSFLEISPAVQKEVLLSHKLQDLVLVKPRSSSSASKIPVYKHIPSDPARFCVSIEQLNWGEGGGKSKTKLKTLLHLHPDMKDSISIHCSF